MDIRKYIREIILEQNENTPQLTRGQRDQLITLTKMWRETVPEITDEMALVIYLKIREVLPKIDPSGKQVAVSNFLRRHDGSFGSNSYTIDDLKSIVRVDLKSLVDFLAEFSNFKNPFKKEGNENDVNDVFENGGEKITQEKIEVSKSLWEGSENKIIDEGDFRVYEIKTQEQAKRFGYYYQELLRQKILNNIEKNKTPRTVSPWCIQARGESQQVINENGIVIVNSIGNMYSSYRGSNYFYFVIDESKNLFDDPSPGKNYYIGSVMATPNGMFKEVGMYNGEVPASWERIVEIWPKIAQHRDKLVYKDYDPQVELNAKKTTILDIINEDANSPYDFSRQTKENKQAYIVNGRPLSNPRSWEALTNDLRQEYINGFTQENSLERCNNFDFFKSIVNSSATWKRKLDERLKQIGKPGVIELVRIFMKNDFTQSIVGAKNNEIVIFQNVRNKKYGIFDVKQCDFLNKDGINYDPVFVKGNRIDIDDDVHGASFWVFEYIGDSGNKFYTLHDDDFVGEDRNKAYILSEKKWNEIKDNFMEDTTTTDLPQQTDIGENKKGV